MLNKRLISHNFSRSAATYDRHALLQRKMADELLDKIKSHSPLKILDVGCGTGYLTMKMAAMFPQAEVIGIDIAPGMIAEAKKRGQVNLSFMLGDGEELAFPDHCFDLIVSNATLQWMVADKSLIEAKRLLKSGGRLVFNTFGPATLKELKEAGFRVNVFRSIDELRRLAGKLFTEVKLTSRGAKEKFNSLRELILHLKTIGAHSAKPGKGLLNKNRLRSLLDKPVAATFEVISGSLVA